MILFILIGVGLAALQKKRIRVVFKETSLIPLWITEIVFWIFQIAAWRGDYRFIRYAGTLQTVCTIALVFPILRLRLYREGLIGAVMSVTGTLFNRIVMQANGGQMPVYPTLSTVTGYFKNGVLTAAGDARHALMSSATRLPFLGDFIDVGFSILSPGDLLIHGFVTLIVYAVIATHNRKEA